MSGEQCGWKGVYRSMGVVTDFTGDDGWADEYDAYMDDDEEPG